MSFTQKIVQFFSNRVETGDNHWDESLKTRYYKTTKEKGLEVLENYFENSQAYKINSISKDHGEISVNHKKVFIIATVIMIRPYYTAIDFTVMTESLIPIGFGYNKKEITSIYEQLTRELPLAE